jgi:hypothetical protein
VLCLGLATSPSGGHGTARDLFVLGRGPFKKAQARLGPARHGPNFGTSCMALAPYLRMMVWLCKFQPHLPEKYNGSVNPTEFLQIYSTSILAIGENEVVMTNYFPVVLTVMARSWLRNLHEGSLTSRGEFCRQLTTNFQSAYACPVNEVNLHAVQQRPRESLQSFIQRFSQVRNITPASPMLLLLSLFDRA